MDGKLMKRLLLALLLLAFSIPASAEDRLAWGGSMMVVGGGTPTAAAGYTLKDSFETDEGYRAVADVEGRKYKSGAFTASATYDLRRIGVKAQKAGSPTMNVGVMLYLAVGSGNETPTGSALVTSSTVSASTFPASGSPDWVYYDIPASSYTVDSGTMYTVVMFTDAYSGGAFIRWQYGASTDWTTYNAPDGATWSLGDSNTQMDVRLYSYE